MRDSKALVFLGGIILNQKNIHETKLVGQAFKKQEKECRKLSSKKIDAQTSIERNESDVQVQV